VERAADGLNYLTERLAPGAELGARPASVEVEITPEAGESSEDVEAEMTPGTRALLQKAVELSRMDVSEVMIPYSEIISLPAGVSAAAASEAFRSTGRSRIPLFATSRDDIVGILIAKDLWSRMLACRDAESVVPADLVRTALRVPPSVNAFALIGELQKNRTQMAIVVDEYGGVAGLVTLEDLLEELVGPIEDEHDTAAARQDPLTHLGGTSYEVDAGLTVEELNEKLDLHLPTDEDFETVGGLALHALGRLPEAGATFRYTGIEFTVLDVRRRTIRRLRFDLQPDATMVEDGR
jgi:CBS domain containing-hemolysin-like protein